MRIGGGAQPASLRAAADFGQVVLAALPFEAGADVVRDLHAPLEGKVLLDCSNPVGPGFRLLTEGGPSAAQQLAAAAPGAHVVKAFNLCHEDVWRMRPPVFDGRPLAVPICGDDETALARVRELVQDVGCEPVAGGGLERAGLLEATAALFIGLWVGEGADAQAIAPPLAYAAGPSHLHTPSPAPGG
jgi:predicted dinucleotide-binding enzyme